MSEGYVSCHVLPLVFFCIVKLTTSVPRFSSKENDFCLPQNGRLPPWPPTHSTNATSTPVTTEFCKSSCRTQQSHLMHRAARHLGYRSIDLVDAEGICPGIDVSSFPVSITMLAAFGSNADPPPANSITANNLDGQIEGTEYNWDFYKKFTAVAESAADCLRAGTPWAIGLAAVAALLYL